MLTMDEEPRIRATFNGFPVPDGMTISSVEFSAYVWEQAQQGDERAVQAILGSKGKLALSPIWTEELEKDIQARLAAMPGPTTKEKVLTALRQALLDRYRQPGSTGS